jgi:multidrug efflux system membrane fusion protein
MAEPIEHYRNKICRMTDNEAMEFTRRAGVTPAVTVTVETVKSRKVVTCKQFSGRLEAVDSVDVRPRVSGAIQSVHFREGALVQNGDLLFSIDPAPYAAAVAQAQAQVGAAQAKFDIAKAEFDRGQTLSAGRTISLSELDHRAAVLSEASANLRSAQAGLQTAQLNLDYTSVRAPIAGRVGKIEVTVGNLVAAGSQSEPLARLVSVDPIYATFSVNEQFISQALAQLDKDGTPDDLSRIPVQMGTLSNSGTPTIGKLQLIGNEVDTASGTLTVRAVFDNPLGKLIPGQFVRVRIGQPEPGEHVMISERAIGTDQDKKFVLAVGADNTVTYRAVKLGDTADGQRIVSDGLKDGDRIVVSGLQRVKPGVVVDPQPASEGAGTQ